MDGMIMSKSIDLRVLKTRKLIRDSFIELINKKSFETITINDISTKAQINRSTFYLHYTDKYELLDKTVKEAIDKLLVLVAPEAHIHGRNLEFYSFTQNIQTILRIIADDALLYKAMLGDNGMIDTRKKLATILKQKLRQSFHDQTLIPKELFLELLSSLYMGSITWWLNNDMAYSPAYMAEQLVKMLTMGPVKVAGLVSYDETPSGPSL
jgi:AcrR family transcriptional regulator